MMMSDSTDSRHEEFVNNLRHLNECRRFLDLKFKEINRDEGLDFIPMPKQKEKNFLQQRTDGTPVKSIECLYQAADKISAKLRQELEAMAEVLGKIINPKNPCIQQPTIEVKNLKDRIRADQKATENYMMKIPGPRYAWIYDILRGSVVCNDPLQIATCVSWLKNHTKIIKAKNRFAEPAFNGYRDLLFHIVIEDKETGFSHVCELQVHHRAMLEASEALESYRAYVNFRPYLSSIKFDSIECLLSDLKRLIKEGSKDIDEEFFREVKSECKDVPRLLGIAKVLKDIIKDSQFASKILKRALEVQIEILGKDHVDTAATWELMAQIHLSDGALSEALDCYTRALEGRKRLGFDHSHVSMTLEHKARVAALDEQVGEALMLFRRSILIKRKTFGEDHPETAQTLLEIAMLKKSQGKLKESMADSKSALRVFETYLRDDHPSICDALANIASIQHLNDELMTSLQTYEVALERTKANYGINNHRVADLLCNMAWVFRDLGRESTAVEVFQNALYIYQQMYEAKHVKVVLTKRHIQRLMLSSRAKDKVETCIESNAQKLQRNAIDIVISRVCDKFMSKWQTKAAYPYNFNSSGPVSAQSIWIANTSPE